MPSIFDELFRIRQLREDKSKRVLGQALVRVSSCELALAQISQEITRFVAAMPRRIDAEYQKLEEEANATAPDAENGSTRGGGVALHRVQSFRAFELDLYAQRDALRVAQQERQQALKLAQEERVAARAAYAHAQRGRLKIEELQTQERKRLMREEEHMEEKQLEEFKPRSIFAHLQ